jgi:hypothetical protein
MTQTALFRLAFVIVVAFAAVMPFGWSGPRQALAAPCDLVGNSQVVYDEFDNENIEVTVDYCGFNTLDPGEWGLMPPSDGYGYYELVVRYDAFSGYTAGPYSIYVANCNGYLSAPNWVFLEQDPYDDFEQWDYLQPGGAYFLDSGYSISALLIYEISETATVAHTYFITFTSQDMQLIDLTLDGGFYNADAAPSDWAQMTNALPNTRLRGCRAH